MSRQEYVVGFLHDENRVALVKKNRPQWQDGLLNGIGGKIEKYDPTPLDAMRREFQEEAGVYISGWDYFLKLSGQQSVIHCFAYFDYWHTLDAVKTMEDEEIVVKPITSLNVGGRNRTVPNVRWILPLMLQRENYLPITVDFHDGTRGTA